jgi:hypothetical protein
MVRELYLSQLKSASRAGDIVMPIFPRVLAVLAALLAFSAGANVGQPFDAKAFQEAQASGKTILLDVAASWCPVCCQGLPTMGALG